MKNAKGNSARLMQSAIVVYCVGKPRAKLNLMYSTGAGPAGAAATLSNLLGVWRLVMDCDLVDGVS